MDAVLTIIFIFIGLSALAVKIHLHFKLLDPDNRNLMQLGRYAGIDFFLPVMAKYDSHHLRNRKIRANRMLIIFYASALISVYLVLMNTSGF